MKKKRKRNDFLTDYIKSVKKIMRETVGLQPTKIKCSVKTYNRNKTKQDVRKILKDL